MKQGLLSLEKEELQAVEWALALAKSVQARGLQEGCSELARLEVATLGELAASLRAGILDDQDRATVLSALNFARRLHDQDMEELRQILNPPVESLLESAARKVVGAGEPERRKAIS